MIHCKHPQDACLINVSYERSYKGEYVFWRTEKLPFVHRSTQGHHCRLLRRKVRLSSQCFLPFSSTLAIPLQYLLECLTLSATPFRSPFPCLVAQPIFILPSARRPTQSVRTQPVDIHHWRAHAYFPRPSSLNASTTGVRTRILSLSFPRNTTRNRRETASAHRD